MRLVSNAITPTVVVPGPPGRRVILRFGGLRFTMRAAEARVLADQLHDGADTAEEVG